jgi:histidinol-phosphate aminotransferase
VIANPNAPTGKALKLPEIRKILEGNKDSVVIIDEAYVDFGGDSAVGLMNEYSNLLVIHTLSKSRSLAGMRVGFAFGDRELVKALESVKNSFNSYTLDRLAIIAGTTALGDPEYYREATGRVIATRERFVREIRNRGFKVIDSAANFIFTTHVKIKAEKLFKDLRDRGILVRYFKKPVIDNYLRISIGTDDEMNKVIEALDGMMVSGGIF